MKNMSWNIILAVIILSFIAIPAFVSADSGSNTGYQVQMMSTNKDSGYFHNGVVEVQASNGIINSGHTYAIGEEIVDKRTENSKTTYLGKVGKDEKYSVKVSVGPIHYKDDYSNPNEQWKDIDLTIVNGRMTKAPYELTINNNLVTMRDKKTGEIANLMLSSIDSKPITLPQMTMTKGKASAANVATDTDVEIVLDNTKIRFTRVLKSAKAPVECMFSFTQTGTGITLTSEAEDSSLSGNRTIPVKATHLGTVLIESIDRANVRTYPVRVDPTLSIYIAASADDCALYGYAGAYTFTTTSQYIFAGFVDGNAPKTGGGFRFAGVSVPNSATINSANFSLCAHSTQLADTVNTRITGEDVDNAASFSTVSNFVARRGTIVGGANDNYLTTATVNWDAIPHWSTQWRYYSPDIKTVIAEITTRPGWTSGNAIVLFWDDYAQRSYQSNNAYRNAQSRDQTSSLVAELIITYTVPVLLTSYDATNAEETSATLNAGITDTGGENASKRGFAWGLTSNATLPCSTDTPPASYTSSNITSGSYGVGNFTTVISGLTQGRAYYYRASANNSLGWSWSNEIGLITKPTEPNAFAAAGGSATSIGLTWNNGVGADYTVVRYDIGAYPANTAAGTLGYNGTGTGYTQEGLTAGNTYYFRAWSWASEGGMSVYSDGYDEDNMYRSAGIPDIETIPASSITSTTARLNSVVNDDGSDPAGVSVRWGYDNVTHAANFSAYNVISAWNYGNYTVGQTPYSDIGSLTSNMTYYYNVQTQNAYGNDTGTERSFTAIYSTPAGWLPPEYLTGTPSYTSIYLIWSKVGSLSGVRVYYKLDSIPTSNITGALLYSGTDTSTTASSLLSGRSYGFRAYGYDISTYDWSTNSTTLLVTTLYDAGTASNITVPVQPANWFIEPDATALVALPIYPLLDNFATNIEMPIAYFVFILYLIIITALGIVIFRASHDMIMALIGMSMCIIVGSVQHVIPLFMLAAVVMMVISIIIIAKRG